MTKTLVEGPPVYQRLRQHPTNDPTNPAHRLADDAKRMATGSYPANSAALQGIAEDIDAMLTAHASAASRIEELEAAMGDIAEGLVPPIPHGHYLAHRHAVNVARVALRQALPDKG